MEYNGLSRKIMELEAVKFNLEWYCLGSIGKY
jgi:hypothetical protein